ncbi:MAG: polyprenyl synthetase family protein [Desulfohalobiaceae bacterium]|nr:polyprenyl synthetase family protein [Desulfohalobiaceae bacterium]
MSGIYEFIRDNLPRIESCLNATVADLNPLVKPVVSHILGAGGKRLRPMLCLLTARALGYKHDDVYPLAAALELIHSATLLHDDVLDQAELRRSKITAHLVFGVNEAILAGDALLARANEMVTDYGSLSLMRSVSRAIYWTAAGEIQEIQQLRHPSLTVDTYLEIVEGKTGYLLQTCCHSGAILAGASEALEQSAQAFGLNLGIAFQLVDDALDYSVSPTSTGKPKGGDLREGKLTLPLIFFLQQLEPGKQEALLAKMKNRELDEQEQRSIIQAMEDLQLSRKTRAESERYLQIAREALQDFPESQERLLLGEVLEYIKDRED